MNNTLFKFFGGILLIVGTSIGAGMLAMPIATARAGFVDTFFTLIVCWGAMLLGALFILEVNLSMPTGANLISMAEKTLGKPGKAITWVSYLFLLYTLLSAYISGGSDVFQSLLFLIQLTPSTTITTVLFVLVFSLIVYTGIHTVDVVNQVLMYAKLTVFLILLYLIFPHISAEKLSGGSFTYMSSAIMVLITSYGFAIIVPSLRDYFNNDAKVLRRVILIGSLFPLVCYMAWVAAIMGVIPKEGNTGLSALFESEHATSGLSVALQNAVHSHSITNFFRFFSSVSMLTAFLGVSLCLFDFLSDGLKLTKKGWQGGVLSAFVFLPPLLIVLFKPGIYIHALSYAGFFCIILLLLLPAFMVYKARQQSSLKTPFQVPGGQLPILFVILIGLIILAIGLLDLFKLV